MSKPKCKLIGEDGNAFAVMGRVKEALKKAGQGDKVKEYMDKAMSGDYNNLLVVSLEYVDDSSDEECCDEDICLTCERPQSECTCE